MKRLISFFIISLCLVTNMLAQTDNSLTQPPAASEQQPVVNRYQGTGMTDKERYRRSSLCIIMLTHRGKKYATEMERVFKSFPLPLRYNEHNISDLRVISVKGKQERKDIDKLLNSNEIAQKMVGRWFNRDASGLMNMDLIHERGGYGASYSDYQRSQNTVRGTALLRDEGIELLQSTFVLVCDMDYIDQSQGSSVFAGICSNRPCFVDACSP